MTYVVIATWMAAAGEADYVARTLQELTPACRAEPKMISFQAHRSLDNPAKFVLVEHYVDASGYEEHRAGSAFIDRVLGDLVPRLAAREVCAYGLVES